MNTDLRAIKRALSDATFARDDLRLAGKATAEAARELYLTSAIARLKAALSALDGQKESA